MIVKNEAECLGECLESVRGIADELVIADTGSTDDTVSVAQRFGAVVFDVPWADDFAEARNRGMARATGDWLLHLDADEVLDTAGAGRIRAVVDEDGAGEDGARADAIEVTLANYCDAPRAWRWVAVEPGDPMARGYAGYIAAPLLRLFRNGRGFEYREAIHENITESVRERGGVIRPEPILIHHYGFGERDARAVEKDRAYLAIALQKVRQLPEEPKAWFDLGELHASAAQPDEAERAYREALSLRPDYVDAVVSLCNVLLNRGELEESRVLLEGLEARGIAPPHARTALGAIACRQGRLDEARAVLEAVLRDEPRAVMARLYMARVLDRLGDVAGARQELERALEDAPSLGEVRSRLDAHRLRADAGTEYENGRCESALKTLLEALRLDAEDPVIHNDLGVVLNAMGLHDKARESFGRALQLAPGSKEIADNLEALVAGSAPGRGRESANDQER